MGHGKEVVKRHYERIALGGEHVRAIRHDCMHEAVARQSLTEQQE